jgi:hypothetical protein
MPVDSTERRDQARLQVEANEGRRDRREFKRVDLQASFDTRLRRSYI